MENCQVFYRLYSAPLFSSMKSNTSILSEKFRNGKFFGIIFSMYSDTHFHFRHLVRDRGLDGAEILGALAARDTFFALDIGTEADDLGERLTFVEEAESKLGGAEIEKSKRMLRFAAGIWPSAEEIENRAERMKILERQISDFEKRRGKISAVGECGLDHHWNPSGADARSESDFDRPMIEGEMEMFEMQLYLAKRLGLPVIVHSREAFDGTLSAIKNADSHSGIIHCFSYGIGEARAFLDRGFHIAFGGAVTYTKKSKMDEMRALLRFVPDDRILLETDSPYLAPVPFRGKTNTPVLVEYVYRFIAEIRGTTPEILSEVVDENVRGLFGK